MGAGVWGQCCKVDTWVMLGAATQVSNCFLFSISIQSVFFLQDWLGKYLGWWTWLGYPSPWCSDALQWADHEQSQQAAVARLHLLLISSPFHIHISSSTRPLLIHIPCFHNPQDKARCHFWIFTRATQATVQFHNRRSDNIINATHAIYM